MGSQIFPLSHCQLEHEVDREAVTIAYHGSNKSLGLDAVQFCDVTIEQYLRHSPRRSATASLRRRQDRHGQEHAAAQHLYGPALSSKRTANVVRDSEDFFLTEFGDRANEIKSGCGRLGSCSSGGVGSTGSEWNSVPVRRTKHLWWVRPKWLYAKAAVRVTHGRDLLPRGSQRSRTAPGFAAFPQRLLFQEVVAELKRSKKLLRTSPSGDSKGRAVQLGGTRCEGVAVQTSQISIVLWFRKQTGRRRVANQSQGLGDCGTRKSRRPADRKSTRLNSSHHAISRMPSSA